MTYLLPAVIEPPDFIKICVTIPNRPEYIDAFLGSYNYLGRWTAWEQDGTTRARDAARVWMAAIQDTITRWELCGEEDMTIVNNYVNVSCGGCGSTGLPTTIICYGQDGLPVITPQPPVEPNPLPPDGEWPINPTLPPPEEFEDWAAFDGAACIVANYVWAVSRMMVQTLESLGDIAATLAALLVTVIALLPAGAVAAIGGATLLEILKAYGQIILSEQASDIMNEILAWLDERKEEIICTIYTLRHDLPAAMQAVISDGANYVANNVTMSDIEKSGLYEFLFEVFPTSLPFRWLFNIADVPAIGEPIDCATCNTGDSGLDFYNIAGTLRNSAGTTITAGDPVVFGEVYTLQAAPVPEPGTDPFSFSVSVVNGGNVNFWLVNSVGDYEPYPLGSNGPTTQDFDHKQWVVDTGVKYGVLHDDLPIVTNWQGVGTSFAGCGAPGTSAVNPWIITFIIRPLYE